MFDLILATYVTPNKGDATHHSQAENIAAMIILVIILFASIAAIIVACRRKNISNSFSGDIILATFSPILYWVLYAFRCVSHGRVPDHSD